jgi:tetratricopeptide (TPR) repeat protein
MIGRAKELNAVLAKVRAMCAHEQGPNVVFVTGEAGVGKTTFLRALEQEIGETHGTSAPLAVSTECSTPLLGHDVGQVEALQPWAEILERILAHDSAAAKKADMVKLVGSVARAWVDCIPVVGGILGSSLETAALLREHYDGDDRRRRATNQEQMFQQYVNFLAKASEAHPLVLILDDFHWADTSSTNLLFAAARHLGQRRVLFIVAYRADDAASSRGGRGHPLLHVRNELGRYGLFVDVVVPKLGVNDVDALLRERYAHYQGKADFARWLTERSGGNALFVTQYLKTLEEDRVVCGDTGEFLGRYENVRVPTSAFSVVEERIRRLDDESLDLLRYASVEGATFTVSILSALAGIPRLRLIQKLRAIADQHGVIRSLGKQRIYANESTTFQFTNVLLQRALLESLEDEERAELHGLVFDKIKEDWKTSSDGETAIVGVAARLVAHASTPDERFYAANLLRQAARVSWHRFAEEETLGVLRTLRATLDVLLAARVVHGKPDLAAVRALDAEGRMIAGLIHKFRGQHAEALLEFGAAHAVFEEAGAARRAVKAMMREAFALENARRFEEALAASRATLERAEAIGYEKVQAAMWNNLGLVAMALGRPDEALEHQRKSLALREKIGDRVGQGVALGGIGLALFAAGRFEEALEQHRHGLALREELDDRIGQGYALTNIGNTLGALGLREEALTYHRRSVEVRQASGDVVGEIASLDNVAKGLLALGRAGEAIVPLERMAALADRRGDGDAELVHREQLGALLAARGDAAAARRAFTRALALATKAGDHPAIERIEVALAKLPPSFEPPPSVREGARVAEPAPPPPREDDAIPWEARVVMWVEERITRRFAPH